MGVSLSNIVFPLCAYTHTHTMIKCCVYVMKEDKRAKSAVLDVRKKDEFDISHIKGAVWVCLAVQCTHREGRIKQARLASLYPPQRQAVKGPQWGT